MGMSGICSGLMVTLDDSSLWYTGGGASSLTLKQGRGGDSVNICVNAKLRGRHFNENVDMSQENEMQPLILILQLV